MREREYKVKLVGISDHWPCHIYYWASKNGEITMWCISAFGGYPFDPGKVLRTDGTIVPA